MPETPKIYWPTETWRAYLDPTIQGHSELVPGCDDVMAAVDAGEAILIVSELVRWQAFRPTENGERPWDVIEDLLQRPSFVYAESVRQDRDDGLYLCELAAADSKGLGHVEGEHLAFAQRVKATEFHTNHPRLLALNGHPVAKGVKIRLPGREQIELLPGSA